RILKVGVHDDHRVAGREVDAGGQRDLVAEVARQPDEPEPRVVARGLEHQLVGAVAAAVVDEDRLRVAVERLHHSREVRDELLDHALLVVCGNYERVSRHLGMILYAAAAASLDAYRWRSLSA